MFQRLEQHPRELDAPARARDVERRLGGPVGGEALLEAEIAANAKKPK